MNRFFVIGLGFALVIGMATLLIGVIMLRSPDTHGNLWEQVKPGYARTELATLGQQAAAEIPVTQIALEPPRAPLVRINPGVSGQGAFSADAGRRIYLAAACPSCHGLDGKGGTVGASLAGADRQIVKNMVKEGPRGMPAFARAKLSDADLDQMAAYLAGLETAEPTAEELAALQRLSDDPLVPLDVLLKGKAALRKSCGACHTPPTKEELRGAFDLGSLLASMVQETNLSLEDAKLIGYYILAIRKGADPIGLR